MVIQKKLNPSFGTFEFRTYVISNAVFVVIIQALNGTRTPKKWDRFLMKQNIQHGPKNFDELLQQLHFVFDDLEEIYFAGGEPMLMEEHYAILDLLLKHGKTDVKLRYATNFSQTVYKEETF